MITEQIRPNLPLDPHYLPYGSINLDKDFWRECQRDKKSKELSNKMMELFSEELTAVIPKHLLEDLGFEVAADCGMSYTLMTITTMWHFYSVALCILSHGKMEDEITQVRFSKSPYNNKAYLPENIKVVNDSTCRWGKNVLKNSKPEVVIEVPIQRSLFS